MEASAKGEIVKNQIWSPFSDKCFLVMGATRSFRQHDHSLHMTASVGSGKLVFLLNLGGWVNVQKIRQKLV